MDGGVGRERYEGGVVVGREMFRVWAKRLGRGVGEGVCFMERPGLGAVGLF